MGVSFSQWNNRRELITRRVSSSLDTEKGVNTEKDDGTENVTELDKNENELWENEMTSNQNSDDKSGVFHSITKSLRDKVGTIEESRLVFPEIVSGEVPRTFSNISYKTTVEKDGKVSKTAVHNGGNVLSAATLVSGTAIGAGILALPTATAPAGFLPSSAGLFLAWLYMTISGLLIAELSINRMGETGKQGVGLLEIYKSSLGNNLGRLGSGAYFFLHYAIMVAYFAQGGANLGAFFDSQGLDSISSVHGLDQIVFATGAGSLIYFANPSVVEKVNNGLVFAVVASFLGILGVGFGSADFGALVAPENQHPELIVNAFPILFLSLVYQSIVPTVVNKLEGDRRKITEALILGTGVPLIMLLAWNAIILGNVASIPGAFDYGLNPVSLLQSEGLGGETLGQLVGIFSELAVTTSLIGVIYGLLDGLTDVFNVPTKGPQFEKWKPALFAGVLLPPLALSLGNPDIFYDALDFGGAFGVSTLFLFLPPLMVWKLRYSDKEKSLTVPPMVPFGKIPLGSLWKAAATLIFEQGAEKLGAFDFIHDTFLS